MQSAQIEAAESLAHMVKHLTWRVSNPSVRLDCTGAAPFLRIHIARISWTGKRGNKNVYRRWATFRPTSPH